MRELAKQLHQYLSQEDVDRLLKFRKEFISLETCDDPTTCFSSKVGGFGYLPDNLSYPTNEKSQPLSLLVQINFSEMPKLTIFPKKGILAFYVDYFDDFIGLDFTNPTIQKGFKVYFFPDLEIPSLEEAKQKTLFSRYEGQELWKIVEKEQKLKGHLTEMFPIFDTVEFTQSMGEKYGEFLERTGIDEEKEDMFNSLFLFKSDTQIGGYPTFTQSDPREYDKELEELYNVLLFQLDSDANNIMWGDSGIGNFFINNKKLLNQDFSDVLYNWDCY